MGRNEASIRDFSIGNTQLIDPSCLRMTGKLDMDLQMGGPVEKPAWRAFARNAPTGRQASQFTIPVYTRYNFSLKLPPST